MSEGFAPGDRVRITTEQEGRRTWNGEKLGDPDVIYPQGAIVTVTGTASLGSTTEFWVKFDHEGRTLWIQHDDVEKVTESPCTCPPHSLLLYGCTCGENK